MPKIQNFCLTEPEKYCENYDFHWGYYDKNGSVIIHNSKGPAIKNASGTIFYYRYGDLHRNDGPAVIDAAGYEQYFKYDKSFSKEAYYKFTGVIKKDKIIIHYVNGIIHNDTDPAYIIAGNKYFYKKGKIHKSDGPAHISKRCFTYYRNNKKHRVGGPAYVSKSGLQCYYFNDKLHRTDGPAIIRKKPESYDYYGMCPYNVKEGYYINGELHRIDGPALIYFHGRQEYYYEGKRHRLDGPAIITKDFEAHYIKGKFYTKEHFEVIKNNPSILNFQ